MSDGDRGEIPGTDSLSTPSARLRIPPSRLRVPPVGSLIRLRSPKTSIVRGWRHEAEKDRQPGQRRKRQERLVEKPAVGRRSDENRAHRADGE